MDIPALVLKTGGAYTLGLSNNVPGIAALRDKMYARVLAIPWVDGDALRAAFSETDNGAVWVPQYAIRSDAWKTGVYSDADLLHGVPGWLAGDMTHAVAWNHLTDWWRDNVMPVLVANSKVQASLLQKAYDDITFWDALYKFDVAVASLPGRVASAASGVVGSVFSGLFPVVIMAGVLFAAFIFSRSQLRKAD